MRSMGTSAAARPEVAARSGKWVSGPAQADDARAIHALVDARPLLGRKHSREGKNQ